MCIALDEMMKDHEMIGEVRGEVRMNRLVQILLEGGKVDELKRAAQDSDYRMELYKEFEIVQQEQKAGMEKSILAF